MHAHPHNLTHTATIIALVCHIAQRTGTTTIDTTPRGGNCNDQAVIIIYDSVPLGHLMGIRDDWGPVQKEVPTPRRWVYLCRARALAYQECGNECHKCCSVREIAWVCMHPYVCVCLCSASSVCA